MSISALSRCNSTHHKQGNQGKNKPPRERVDLRGGHLEAGEKHRQADRQAGRETGRQTDGHTGTESARGRETQGLWDSGCIRLTLSSPSMSNCCFGLLDIFCTSCSVSYEYGEMRKRKDEMRKRGRGRAISLCVHVRWVVCACAVGLCVHVVDVSALPLEICHPAWQLASS